MPDAPMGYAAPATASLVKCSVPTVTISVYVVEADASLLTLAVSRPAAPGTKAGSSNGAGTAGANVRTPATPSHTWPVSAYTMCQATIWKP